MSWVVITGGAKGLGAAICQRLAASGHSLIIHYNKSGEEADQIQHICQKYGVKTYLVQGTFDSKESVDKIADTILSLNLPVKYLVNNVGRYLVKNLLNTTSEEWYELFQVNTYTPFLLTKKLSDSIISQKGSIVNIGFAGLETRKADSYCSVYSMTKQVLLAMTKTVAKELVSQEVTVNMISPGYLTNSCDFPSKLSDIPMGRAIDLSEVADMVNYLFSDSAKSITGQNIEISGGVRL